MSIDWEELLDASGDELQDTYDALCDSEWEDDPWDEDDFDEEESLDSQPLPIWEETPELGLPVRDERREFSTPDAKNKNTAL